MSFLSEFLKSIAERGQLFTEFTSVSRRKPEIGGLEELCRHLLSNIGEATELATATEILSQYQQLEKDEQLDFFRLLLDQFGPDCGRVRIAVDAFNRSPDPAVANRLHAVSEPLRQNILRRLNQVYDGTSALMSIRADLLSTMREHPELSPVDDDFKHLFSSWFNRGFLELRHVDWQTPAAILEKIIRYEAVHEICDWNELRARIDPPDRRLYAFFHPRVRDEPLIFVEVALMKELPSAIAQVLGADREVISVNDATTAIFYSISDCQPGLRGISFGNFLIKQVVEELRRELPYIKWFATLSPVPGLTQWITGLASAEMAGQNAELDEKLDRLREFTIGQWWTDKEKSSAAERILLPLAADYLLNAKNANGWVLDPVARFHLRNGARLERINWLSDKSALGRKSSYTIMVNYLYDREEIECNHENFVMHGGINASSPIHKLAQSSPGPTEKVSAMKDQVEKTT